MTLAMPAPADGGLERQQLLVAELARADVGRRLVEPALGEAVADEVLGGRGDAGREVRALEPADVGRAQDGREVRVLAVRLLDAAPARVAADVEDRRERHGRPDRPHPAADRGRDRLDELRVERRGGADRLLEDGRVAGEQAVERLLVEERRDPEPRLLDEEALDRVAGLGGGGRVEVRRAGDPADVADARRRAARGRAPGPAPPRSGTARTTRSSRAGRASPRASSARAGRRRARRPAGSRRGSARRSSSSALHRSGREAADDLALGEQVEDERGDERERRVGEDRAPCRSGTASRSSITPERQRPLVALS